MLAAYRIDTTNIIGRYATYPRSRSSQLALAWLKDHALTTAYVDMAIRFPEWPVEARSMVARLSLGITEKPGEEARRDGKITKTLSMSDIYKMPPEKQKEAYLQLVASIGMAVDPSVFVAQKKDEGK